MSGEREEDCPRRAGNDVEVVVAYFTVLQCGFRGGTNRNHDHRLLLHQDEHWLVYRRSGQAFYPVQCKVANHCTAASYVALRKRLLICVVLGHFQVTYPTHSLKCKPVVICLSCNWQFQHSGSLKKDLLSQILLWQIPSHEPLSLPPIFLIIYNNSHTLLTATTPSVDAVLSCRPPNN